MLATYPNPVKAYADVAVATSVSSASPLELVLLLYQGALQSLVNAKGRIRAGDKAGKAKSLHKAVEIINSGLYASLDPVMGGELAKNLKDLYEYMGRQLLLANANDDIARIDEVHALLTTLYGAWKSLTERPEVVRIVNQQSPRSMVA